MQRLLIATDNTLVTARQSDSMKAFCRYLDLPLPEIFQLKSVNSFAVLIHWKAILLMVARMGSEEREYWKEVFPVPHGVEIEWNLPRALDSHFHLDRTIQTMRLSWDATLKEVLVRTPIQPGKEVKLLGCCASFCDPDTYPSSQSLLDFPSNMCVAVGFHPRHVSHRYQEDDMRALRELIKSDRIVAVGEIGLDHDEPIRHWHKQMEILDKILSWTESRHVVVFHCRGMVDDDGSEAYLLLLHLVKQKLTPQHRIYLHCFSGTEYVLQRWMDAFTNLYCGFTRLVRSFNEGQLQALRRVPEDRILLERDAPYFREGQPWSAPNQLYSVAECISPVRNVPVEALLASTAVNAKRLFLQQ